MDRIRVSEARGSITGRRGLYSPDEAVSLDNLFSLERLPMGFGWFCNLYFYTYMCWFFSLLAVCSGCLYLAHSPCPSPSHFRPELWEQPQSIASVGG